MITTPTLKQEILALRELGLTNAQIARALGGPSRTEATLGGGGQPDGAASNKV